MADRFYSVIVGEHQPSMVTEGASTSSEAIELRVNDSAYASKIAILLAIDCLKNYINTRETTPIA